MNNKIRRFGVVMTPLSRKMLMKIIDFKQCDAEINIIE